MACLLTLKTFLATALLPARASSSAPSSTVRHT